MTAQETITKLIEKYEAKINECKKFIDGSFSNGVLLLQQQYEYYSAKQGAYSRFLTDLKELQNTINK